MSPSAAYSTSLVVDGDDWTRSDFRILMRVTHGLWDGLEVRGTDTTVPSRPGQIARSRVANSRIIPAEGSVNGEGADEAEQRADFLALRQYIDSKMRGDLPRYEIEVTLEDGSTASIMVQPLRVEWINDQIPSRSDLVTYWLATDPPDWTITPAVS